MPFAGVYGPSWASWVYINTFVSYYNTHKTEYNPLKIITAQFEKIKDEVIEKIKLFGSAGRV